MAWGRRCAIGCESWPDELIYQKCPECGEPTERISNLSPIHPEEGRSILRHKAFERFYEDHCRKKGQPVEGPLPSVLDAPGAMTPEEFADQMAKVCSSD